MASGAIKKIGFVGTGIMGAPIAGHLIDAGFELSVYNRTASKADDLVARGARRAATPADAARDADLIFTMVGYPNDVEDVYLGTDGILDAAPKGAWLVDLTTSSPELARELHDAAEVVGKHAVDCPVTGGESGAIDGTLTLILGATEAEAEPIQAALEAFSSKIFYFGAAGKGQLAKLCNQISLASCMVGMADMLSFAELSGIDADQILEMVGSGMGSSRALTSLGPKAAHGDWAPGFLVEHLRKDLALSLNQADDYEIALPGAETAFSMYDMLTRVGGAKLGTQAVELLYAEAEVGQAAGLDYSVLEGEDECCHGEGDGCCHGEGHAHGDGECCCHGEGHAHGGCCHHHDHE